MRKKKRKKFKRFKFKRVKFKLSFKLFWMGGAFLFVAVFLAGLGYAIYTSEVFIIKEENIESNVVLSESVKEKIKGRSLFNLDIKSISFQLRKKYSECKEICITKRFPSTVIIEIKKRAFFAQIKGKKFYPVDREAVILSGGRIEFFPNLISVEIADYNRIFKKGDVAKDKRLEYAFNLIDALREEDFFEEFPVKLINSTDLQAIYFDIECKSNSAENIKIKIGKDNFKQKIKRLKNLINQELKNKMPLVKYIDLRYKKVYVGFKR